MRRSTTRLYTNCILALATSLASAAHAQLGPPAPASSAPGPAGTVDASTPSVDAGADIIVTGTLIRGTAKNASLPVEILTQDELQKQGSPSPVELLKNLTVSSGVIGDSNQFDSRSQYGEGVATVNLRGLGPARTLVLLNSKRLVNAGLNVPAVDINLLPQAAIGRVEVLKDGAAATYGSDAIAGVVNFITRTDQQGFLASGDYKNIKGSNGDYTGSISYGHHADGLNFLIAAGYQHRSQLLVTARSFADQPFAYDPEDGWTSGGNPGTFRPVTAAGAPVGPAVVDASCTALGGQLTNGGTLAAPVPNGRCYTHATPYDALTDTENRYQIYAETNIDVTDHVKFSVSALYGHSDVPHALTTPSFLLTQAPSTTALPAGTTPIIGFYVPASNPGYKLYVQQNPGTIPTTAAGAVFPLLTFRPFLAGGNPAGDNGSGYGSRQSDSTRFTAGFSGDLLPGIRFDTSFTYHDYVRTVSANDEFGDRVQLALRGLGGANCNIAANTPGQNGCLYLNPFGNASPTNPAQGLVNPAFSAAVANSVDLVKYFYIPTRQRIETQLYVGEAAINGKTGLRLPGGMVSFALGAQYRKTEYSAEYNTNNNIAFTPCRDTPINGNTVCMPSVGALGFGGTNRNGRYGGDVKAVFGELQIPVLDRLNIQAAARYEDYGGGVGSTFNPKATARLQTFKWLAFRGSYGTTFRGPPDQLVANNSTTITQLIGTNYLPVDIFGNPSLKPESATNMSAGAIFDLGRLHFNADYYRYKLKNLIVAEPAALMTSALFATAANCADPAYAGLRRRFLFNDGNGVPGAGTCALTNVQRISTNQINASRVDTSGIDLQLNYSMPDVLGGRASLGGSATYVINYNLADLAVEGIVVQKGYDASGKLNSDTTAYPLPKWKGQAFVEYEHGVIDGRLTANYIDGYQDLRTAPYVQRVELLGLDPNGQNLNGQNVGDFVTFDFNLRAQLRTGTTINLSVINLTDKDPPFVRLNYNYDAFTASALKRQFKLGISQAF